MMGKGVEKMDLFREGMMMKKGGGKYLRRDE